MTRLVLATLLAMVGLVSGARAAASQTPFLVLPQQELTFGQVTPGVPSAVSPTDAARRAEFRLQGQGRTNLVFILPTYLENELGRRMPLLFSATDGLITIRNRSDRFNPAQPLNVRLNPADREARIYLGGTAQPAAGQVAGQYTATITVLVIPSGT